MSIFFKLTIGTKSCQLRWHQENNRARDATRHLKPTIICKSYDVQEIILSVVL